MDRAAVGHTEAPRLRAGVRSGRFDLALLILFTAGLALPFLDPRVVPMHDTFYCFANFHHFYGHAFFRGELLLWFPYGAFGVPAALQQVISFSPLDHVAVVVGALLRVEDALLLFKLARVGEQMLFVSSTWLLARALFADRATALALGLAAAGTVVWYAQIWFDSRFFYLLPLVLYCCVRFDGGRDPRWLWTAALVCVAWAFGNVPYFAPLWAFVLLIAIAPMASRWGTDLLRVLAPTRSNVLLASVVVIAAGVMLHVAVHSVDFVVVRDPGRDAITHAVTEETFLTWGGNARLGDVVHSFWFGRPVHLSGGAGRDNSAYVGLLPLAGLLLALVRERSLPFLGLVAAGGALVWLSLGGVFAQLIFHVPLISQFRHIGLVYGLVRTFVILASGYGLERIWSARPLGRRAAGALGAAFAMASLGILLFAQTQLWALRACLYAALGATGLAVGRSMRAGLLVALAIDVAMYQADVRAITPAVSRDAMAILDAVRVRPLPWQAERSNRPEIDAADPQRSLHAIELAMLGSDATLYWNILSFAHFDSCRSRFWTPSTTWGVDTVLRLEDELDVDVRDALSCKVPKLRFAADPVITHTLQQSMSVLVAGAGEGVTRDAIRVPPRRKLPDAALAGAGSGGSVRVSHFDGNRLEAEVAVAPPGAWLIYADAFHPDWRAFVDGREVPIAEANVGFKAVWVPAGARSVRFRFGRGIALATSWALACLGLLSGLALPAGIVIAARSERRR